MKGRRVALATAWVAPLSLCALVSAQPMERPELRAGDTWVYSVYEGASFKHAGNYESVESFTVEHVLPRQWGVSTGYQMAHTLGAQSTNEAKSSYRLSRDLNIYARGGNPANPQQEVRWLQWPLQPGQSWR